MIDSLLTFFGRADDLPEAQCVQERMRHAVAVLLVEIARADHELHDVELSAMQNQLARSFDLSDSDAADLLDRASRAVEESVSLHEFTRILHAEMSYVEKESVIEMLWRIALADHNIDKYEDYMIAKIAELLYIARGDVIRLRQRVIDSMA
jgi:uncharacterized tellurite resistance protein B-like protein